MVMVKAYVLYSSGRGKWGALGYFRRVVDALFREMNGTKNR
jgi:hypothetical protein